MVNISYTNFLNSMTIHLSAVREQRADEKIFLEAKSYLDDFLAQTNILFGDPDFDWSDGGAYEIISEYTAYD